MDVKIEESWKAILKNEFSKSYFLEAASFLKMEKALHKTIFPPGPLIFNAFNTTPFDKVKVVLLGQDPFAGPGSLPRKGTGAWIEFFRSPGHAAPALAGQYF